MENIKKQFAIFGLLLLMVIVVFTSVLILVMDINWIIKVLTIVLCLCVSAFIFVVIKKINKQLIYIEKTIKEETENDLTKLKIRCPKCLNLYDNYVCLVCGYENKQIKDNN